jgi:oxygen-dependent protoporphyrinogen oxidase
MKSVKVIGGGFSGLVTAYYLSREGFSVELHEASSRLGGLISSEKTPFGLIESAANGFILNDDLMELFQDLNLEPLKPKAEYAKKRYIFRGSLQRWPLNIFESICLAGKFLCKIIFCKKSLRPKTDETVWNWGQRNLSSSATKYLLSPGLQGIYAGDARRMSAELILGPMFQGKKQKYRGTVSARGGMGEFIEALAQKLKSQGVKIILNSNYKIDSLNEPHVVAVSASAAPAVLENVAPQVAETLKKIEVLPVLSVTVIYKNAEKKIEGFGGLFPDDQGFKVLGILSPTYIFAGRGPDYSETWIFGGVHSPEMVTKSEAEILETILQERAKIRFDAGQFHHATKSCSEPRDHFIKNQKSAMFFAKSLKLCQKFLALYKQTIICWQWLDDHSCNLRTLNRKNFTHFFDIIKWSD